MFNSMLRKCIELKLKFSDDIRGMTAVEYAIIAVAMATIILAVFSNGTLKETLNSAMKTVSDHITTAGKTE